jgi:hypothetical protein
MLVYLAIYVAMTHRRLRRGADAADADGDQVEAIADIAGLSRTRPLLAAVLAVVMFSLAGIPPLFGFWGKFVVFQAAVAGRDGLALPRSARRSVIGAFYYLKIVKIMYFDEPAGKATGRSDMGPRMVVGARLCSFRRWDQGPWRAGCDCSRCALRGRLIQTVPETGSTNADLAARLAAGEFVVEGEWLVADRQTAGKGRQGRAGLTGTAILWVRPWFARQPETRLQPRLALLSGSGLARGGRSADPAAQHSAA